MHHANTYRKNDFMHKTSVYRPYCMEEAIYFLLHFGMTTNMAATSLPVVRSPLDGTAGSRQLVKADSTRNIWNIWSQQPIVDRNIQH